LKPSKQIGVCGEHAGDAKSVKFFDEIGLDYVSCSPYRMPVAKIAAAQSHIKAMQSKFTPGVCPLKTLMN